MVRTKNIDIALIYALWSDVADAVRDGDLERWITLWVDEGIQLAPNTPQCSGKNQIREAMQPMFDLLYMQNFVINTEEVWIFGDRAYSHGTYAFEGVLKEGKEIRVCSGKFLNILVKQADGSWKIAIDCHNYNTSSDRMDALSGQGNL